MDNLVAKRLDAFSNRLDALEKRMGGTATSSEVAGLGKRLEERLGAVEERIDSTRGEVIDHVRQVELRLGTAVHGVLAAVQDLKAWHQERDDVRARMQRLEQRLAELEQRTSP